MPNSTYPTLIWTRWREEMALTDLADRLKCLSYGSHHVWFIFNPLRNVRRA